MNKASLSIVLVTLVAAPAVAEPLDPICEGKSMGVVREGFSAGATAGWGFDCAADFVAMSGGNPDAFLRNQEVDSFAPWAMTCTSAAGAFLGDYREKDVAAIAADFKTFSASLTTDERPMSVMLIHHAGTPEYVDDDLLVYYVGDTNIPAPGASSRDGWVHYQFAIPSDSPVLPRPRSPGDGAPGWVAAYGSEVSQPADDPDAVWNTVIENVDQVIFWWHDPRYFAILQSWDVGMDNPALITCAD
jgi:hypothetical protein